MRKSMLMFLSVVLTFGTTVSYADEYTTYESYDAQDGSSTVYADSSGLHRSRSYNRAPSYGRAQQTADYEVQEERRRTEIMRQRAAQAEYSRQIQYQEHYLENARIQREREEEDNNYQRKTDTFNSISQAAFSARNVAQSIKDISNMTHGSNGGGWYPW